MKLHFLLTAEARSLSLVEVLALSDDAAFAWFRRLRWGDGEAVVCPHCGLQGQHYFRPARKIWRCAACRADFSVTSGSLFAFHKLPLKFYLAAIILFANAVKGLSALQLARDLTIQHKSAFVRLHKIREGLWVTRDDSPLSGEVQVDGAYVGGVVRPENRVEDRVDRRLSAHHDPNRRCILVMREGFADDEPGQGAKRTLGFVVKQETQAALGVLAPRYLAPGSVIRADESSAYDRLHAHYEVHRVCHAKAYRAPDGTTNNQAESYFSRFRRLHIGQVHHLSPKYLDCYVHEIAYREDTRRWPNGDIFDDIVRRCAQARTRRDGCGYWQGNHRQGERLAA